MKWIKSEQRLPDKFKEMADNGNWGECYFMRYPEGAKFAVYPAKTHSGEYMWMDDEAQYLKIEGSEWLDESEEPNQNVLWEECYNKIDELAGYVDMYDFGLPHTQMNRVLEPIKELYTITRK